MNKLIDAHIKGINFFRVAEKPDGVYETTDTATTILILFFWIAGDFALSTAIIVNGFCKDSPNWFLVIGGMVVLPHIIRTVFIWIKYVITEFIIPILDENIKK